MAPFPVTHPPWGEPAFQSKDILRIPNRRGAKPLQSHRSRQCWQWNTFKENGLLKSDKGMNIKLLIFVGLLKFP